MNHCTRARKQAIRWPEGQKRDPVPWRRLAALVAPVRVTYRIGALSSRCPNIRLVVPSIANQRQLKDLIGRYNPIRADCAY